MNSPEWKLLSCDEEFAGAEVGELVVGLKCEESYLGAVVLDSLLIVQEDFCRVLHYFIRLYETGYLASSKRRLSWRMSL